MGFKNHLSTTGKLLAYGLLSVVGHVSAASNIDLEYSGRLIKEPPCTLNQNQSQEVDFGEILTNRIYPPGQYPDRGIVKMVPIKLECKTERPAILWTVSGSPAAFDASAVQTNINDMGIRIVITSPTTGELPVELNKPIRVEENVGTGFFAFPVKRSGSTLPDGHFEATATFRIDFP
ncbi:MULTISPECIES: fimbrial protein [unclassified Serratia (in: enterobacteria)]|uniref:fimbrial protein n=1 Tax=unclassified Serratia (in: enterobacteria) TaxID=2647522 RepID=UPI002ED610C2|nr:fimbrial protein [Serratia sp. C2(2)]MEE4449666.1 fimbrial protein [Serratia sp. C2(1)]